MALDDARAAGELPVTVDGRAVDIELVWIDSESSPEKAVKLTMDSPRAIAPRQHEWIDRYRAAYGEEPSLAPSKCWSSPMSGGAGHCGDHCSRAFC